MLLHLRLVSCGLLLFLGVLSALGMGLEPRAEEDIKAANEEGWYKLELLARWLSPEQIDILRKARVANARWLAMKSKMFSFQVGYDILMNFGGKMLSWSIVGPYDRGITLTPFSEDLLYYLPELATACPNCLPNIPVSSIEEIETERGPVYEWMVLLRPVVFVGRQSLVDPFPPALQRGWMNPRVVHTGSGGAMYRAVIRFDRKSFRVINERFESWTGREWVPGPYGQHEINYYYGAQGECHFPTLVIVRIQDGTTELAFRINFKMFDGLWMAESGAIYENDPAALLPDYPGGKKPEFSFIIKSVSISPKPSKAQGRKLLSPFPE